ACHDRGMAEAAKRVTPPRRRGVAPTNPRTRAAEVADSRCRSRGLAGSDEPARMPDGPAVGEHAPVVGAGPTDTALPDGLRVVVDRRVVALDGGRVLLGGAPPRMLRLTPAG